MTQFLVNRHRFLSIVFIVFSFIAYTADANRADSDPEWRYEIADGGAVITGCTDKPNGYLRIPNQINGYDVTCIGEKAFERLLITGVSIPSGVKYIGDYAFRGCYFLKEAALPDSVITVGKNPFAGCVSLTQIPADAGNTVFTTLNGMLYDQSRNILIACPAGKTGSVTVPGSTLKIGAGAFSECAYLTRVNLPPGLTEIGEYAFSRCRELKTITIPGKVAFIGQNAFESCIKLKSLTFEKGTGPIGKKAFLSCEKLAKVTIPGSVTEIGDEAFSQCTRLKTVILQKGIQSIGAGAFSLCTNLTKITLPETLTSLGAGAFYYGGIKSVGAAAQNPVFKEIDGVLFNTEHKILIVFPVNQKGSYSVPKGTEVIGESAFSGCARLTNITLPDGVTHIEKTAFFGCGSLTGIKLPNSVTEIGEKAFSSCRALTHVTLPGGAVTIDATAFAGSQVTLIVAKGSQAEQYAREHNLAYAYE